MSCTSCHSSDAEQAAAEVAARHQTADIPLNVNDLQVVDQGAIRDVRPDDWTTGHKLVLFYPESFTPVCASELGALNDWLPRFEELGCTVYVACTDRAEMIADWYSQEPALRELGCLTLSSYQLPARLTLVDHGRAKRSSVFFMADGEIVKQEHFHKVGRSLAELHRMLYGYTTESYCAEGWRSPQDGFLPPQTI